MHYVRTTAPAESPVLLDVLKAHLRIEVDDPNEDLLLQGYLDAVVDHLDGRSGILGRCLVTQEWQAYADAPERLPGCVGFRIDLGPVVDETPIAVAYRVGGAWLAVDPASLHVMRTTAGGAIVMKAFGFGDWPAADRAPFAWRLTFSAGTAPAEVPAAIRAAILLLAADLNGDRGGKTVANMLANPTIDRLLSPYRMVSV